MSASVREYTSEFVSYQPTKSASYGHQTGVRDSRTAWKGVEQFLEAFTIFSPPTLISFRCVSPFSGSCTVFNEFRVFANRELGTTDQGEWQFRPEQLPQALHLAFAEHRWPKQADGPAWLSFSYDFEWKELPRLGETTLPQSSRLHVIVSAQRIFLQPTFVFPQPWDSLELLQFLHDVKPHLPLRLRDQYFRRLLPSKKGDFRALKLPKDWPGFDALNE